jgi:phage gp37-like protein
LPTQLKIEDVHGALMAALTADAGIVAAQAQVSSITDKTVDAEGNLIVTPPAILPMYSGTQDSERGDTTRTTYKTEHDFLVLCGAQDLSSPDNERISCEKLVSLVRKALAGFRLTLPGPAQTDPIKLNGVEFFQFDTTGTWFGVKIVVSGTAQFS